MRRSLVSLSGIVVCLFLLFSGCFNAPTSGLVSVPKDTATTCRTHCSQLGLRMSAVVIILNSAGCVCEPGQVSGRSRTGAAAVAGAAVIRRQQEEQEQRRK